MNGFLFYNDEIFTVISLKVIIALLLMAIVLSGCTQQQSSTTTDTTGNASASVKEFSVTLKQFSFDPSTITVKKGDTVKLNVTSVDVPHGFSLPEFGVNVTPQVGETRTAEFVADKAGTFTFRCSVFCGTGHSTMAGTFVVEE